jgi:hypothetical protein
MEFVLTHPDVGLETISILKPDGVPVEADSNHPWWNEIVDFVLRDDERALALFPLKNSLEAETDRFLRSPYDIRYDRMMGIIPCGIPSCKTCCKSCYPSTESDESLDSREGEIDGRENKSIALLREELRAAEKDWSHQYDRAEFLESAARNYAPHAWPEIERALEQL